MLVQAEAASVSLPTSLPSARTTCHILYPTLAGLPELTWLGRQAEMRIPPVPESMAGPQPARDCGSSWLPAGKGGTSSPELWAAACWPSRKAAAGSLAETIESERIDFFFFQLHSHKHNLEDTSLPLWETIKKQNKFIEGMCLSYTGCFPPNIWQPETTSFQR